MNHTARTPYDYPPMFSVKVSLANAILTLVLLLVVMPLALSGTAETASAILGCASAAWNVFFFGVTVATPKIRTRMDGWLWARLHRGRCSDPIYRALATRPWNTGAGLPHAAVAEPYDGGVRLLLVRAEDTGFDSPGTRDFQYRVLDQRLLAANTSQEDLADATLRMMEEAERMELKSHVQRRPEDRHLLAGEQSEQESLDFVRRVLGQD